jgi:hypothetical protein
VPGYFIKNLQLCFLDGCSEKERNKENVVMDIVNEKTSQKPHMVVSFLKIKFHILHQKTEIFMVQKLSLQQAVKVNRAVRCRGSHIF